MRLARTSVEKNARCPDGNSIDAQSGIFEYAELAKGTQNTVLRMFAPGESMPTESLERLIKDAVASTDKNYGIREAVKWVDGFEFLQELVDSDLRLLQASRSDFTKETADEGSFTVTKSNVPTSNEIQRGNGRCPRC